MNLDEYGFFRDELKFILKWKGKKIMGHLLQRDNRESHLPYISRSIGFRTIFFIT